MKHAMSCGVRCGQVENGFYSVLELRCYCTQQKLSKIECLCILAGKSTYKICEQSLYAPTKRSEDEKLPALFPTSAFIRTAESATTKICMVVRKMSKYTLHYILIIVVGTFRTET